MKKLKYALLLGSLAIVTALSGCGDGNISHLKESSLYYSDTKKALFLKKVDGAPQIGAALEKAIPNGKWKNEEEEFNGSKEEYIVYKATLKVDEMKAIKDNLDHHDQFVNALRTIPYEKLDSRFECDLDGNAYVMEFYFKEVDKDNFALDSLRVHGDEKTGYDSAFLDQYFVLMELLEKVNPDYDFQKDNIPLIYIPKVLQEAAEKIQKFKDTDKAILSLWNQSNVYGDLKFIAGVYGVDNNDTAYSWNRKEISGWLTKDTELYNDTMKKISDMDFGNPQLKEKLIAKLNKEKELVDLCKDIVEKRNGMSLTNDKAVKDFEKGSFKDFLLKADKAKKACQKATDDFNQEYLAWQTQNKNDIEKIQNQVWQR